MGNESQKLRTDHTPLSVLKKRDNAAMERRDQYVGSTSTITVKYALAFDDFAANVAHKLRHWIVYRTDGGRFARALVRKSGSLEKLHRYWNENKVPPGSSVKLVATLYRRQDPLAANRWMMEMFFEKPSADEINFDESDGEIVIVRRNRVKELQMTAMSKIIRVAVSFSYQNSVKPGEEFNRILKMAGIAERLGSHKAWDLWYYNYNPMRVYIFNSTNSQKKEMTKATNGAMPFDGRCAYTSSHWRTYPFREMAQKHGLKDLVEMTNGVTKDVLMYDQRMLTGINKISADLSKIRSGGGTLYKSAWPFVEHLQKLLESPDHLYYAYDGPAKDRGIFERAFRVFSNTE
ncbi:hypothetical protein BN873_350105 [Candidatus Competibacter denitrificans Run_A_D11]|uniref:Uncharacterized protein n=1 Tax=Candidatus Competibacter denitrificans Run_A_D11 TaxID=1400863 RepID=W6M874_9GAMM|nr:hypothetical protein [Candidatus Competibacter denitrificans]CDI02849.1 hypothetical protein BN873_350105 [Candidatus Competibacter denitrificans Run_A_D11]HRC69843.1 hypothetical protein [Candidatus Competibacter denitrificans]